MGTVCLSTVKGHHTLSVCILMNIHLKHLFCFINMLVSLQSFANHFYRMLKGYCQVEEKVRNHVKESLRAEYHRNWKNDLTRNSLAASFIITHSERDSECMK